MIADIENKSRLCLVSHVW